MDIKRDILWRVYLCFIGMMVLSVMVLGRAFYLQRVEGNYWRSLGDSLHQRVEELGAERGTIYSEDGSMLSTSVPQFDIYIDFAADGLREKAGKRFTENLDSLSYCLAQLFKDKDAATYKRDLRLAYRNKSRYYSLHKKVSFAEYIELREFPLVRQGRYKSGFIVEVQTKRLTPFGLLANRTIGLARENAQNVGLENTYDSLLKGSTGKRLVRQIAGGAFAPIEGTEIEPEKGKDIITTLDVNIQDIAENALLKMLIENEATNGTCIVMEVKTGKIKAIANLGRQTDGSYWENYNYAITASEPGSTFKLATLLAALEDKHVTLKSHVNLEGGTWQIGRRTVYDSEEHGKYDVTVKEAFEHSSNVGMAKLAMQYYAKNPESFLKHLRKMRFDKTSGIDLLGESKPVVKSPSNRSWSAVTLPWMSFGYEVQVSPLQTLMLYNAVANGGKMMRPYLVNSVMKDGLLIQDIQPHVLDEQICSPETLKQLQSALEGVMTGGTGKKLWSPFYGIAGKTGTSLVANGNRGYADKIYQSSFAGYFPSNDPQYSCIVVIKNKPHALQYYGGSVAGPVFKEVADKLYALRIEEMRGVRTNWKKDSSAYQNPGYKKEMEDVMKELALKHQSKTDDTEWAKIEMNEGALVVNNLMIEKNGVPDVKGMVLKDALYMLENKGYQVKVTGSGKVKNQSAPTINGKNKIIYLELQ